MVEHLPCKQGVRSSTLLTSTMSDESLDISEYIDNRIKKKYKQISKTGKAKRASKTIKLRRA